jgi:hypothetical protein
MLTHVEDCKFVAKVAKWVNWSIWKVVDRENQEVLQLFNSGVSIRGHVSGKRCKTVPNYLNPVSRNLERPAWKCCSVALEPTKGSAGIKSRGPLFDASRLVSYGKLSRL